MPNTLEEFKKYTVVVADTGDFELAKKYTPQDMTTNPSLILKACTDSRNDQLMEGVLQEVRKMKTTKAQKINEAKNRLLTIYGREILNIIPGRVSTEIDPTVSFSVNEQVKQGRLIINLYKKMGIDKDKILIKIASTLEGIKACKILEAEGIHCNMTLIFCLEQAIACADANATIISPFLGRINDWIKKNGGYDANESYNSIKAMHAYYKKHNIKTKVMPASLRTAEDCLKLTGVDFMTIPPNVLDELMKSKESVKRTIDDFDGKISDKIIKYTDNEFMFLLTKNRMASDLLFVGIHRFAEDTEKLKMIIEQKL
ncbi:hypothetical protein SNEBB_002526 [Seison nebaliae]|nr:hypothetical protein SNEBB_002526 [Seison nebaliae]